MRIASLGVALLAPALGALLACGGDERIAEGSVEVQGGDEKTTVAARGDAGFQMQAGEAVELPKDFPDDVPLYPKWKIVASVNAQGGMLVSAQSPEDPDAIVTFYKDEFSDAGWEVQAEMNMGPQRMISFAKGDRQVTLTAARDAGETQISLMVNR